MEGPFLALLLTFNSAGLENIDVQREFATVKHCQQWVERERLRRYGKAACVPKEGLRRVLNEAGFR